MFIINCVFNNAYSRSINIVTLFPIFWSISSFLFSMNFGRNREMVRETYLTAYQYFVKDDILTSIQQTNLNNDSNMYVYNLHNEKDSFPRS